jgi:hypothetical protein
LIWQVKQRVKQCASPIVRCVRSISVLRLVDVAAVTARIHTSTRDEEDRAQYNIQPHENHPDLCRTVDLQRNSIYQDIK